jgi:hypothetical protein
MLSGVTLITHGFGSDVDAWVTEMAEAIAARPDLTIDQPRYRVEVTDPGHDGGELSVVNTSRTGPSPTAPETEFPESVILLDWSDVAGNLTFGGGYHRSAVDVAAAVAAKLVEPGFLVGLSSPVAELAFHLIGHSRGASLVGQLAHDLGQLGIWVDQVTTLDPHPVDRVKEPWLFNYDFGDAPMTAWDNVVFWDNYWRTEGSSSFDFTGESVEDTYDVQLDESVLQAGGYSNEHSDVHLWYHGTIDTSANPPANDGDQDVPNQWYGGAHPAREGSGYYFSRVVGGTRDAKGLAYEFGGEAIRTSIDASQAVWPNVMDLEIDAEGLEFAVGDLVPTVFYSQDSDADATVTLYLDTDRNPYNGHIVESETVAPGVNPGPLVAQHTTSLPTSGIADGSYYVSARIRDSGGRTRYEYTSDPITLISSVQEDGVINFLEHEVASYGGPRQDLKGSASVEDAGATLHLTGNVWKKIDLPYNVTENTLLEFDFKSTSQGEIHGIGLDTDLSISANRTFQLYGTQNWANSDFEDYASSAPGYKHYRIPIGQYYTGQMDYLFFVNDHDVANPSAVSFFSNVQVLESQQIDFRDHVIASYGGPRQDVKGSASVEDNGATLHLVGNVWKKIDLPYGVTENTLLEFDFKSTSQGEIHGIGLDTDLSISVDRTFELYGTQNWGNSNYKDYGPSAPGYKHYRIPIGQYYTGQMNYLFFVNDHDVSNPLAESYFRNVRVYEG